MQQYVNSRAILFSATIALASLLVAPLPALADDELDDLDVTMEVVGDESELREFVSEMRGPDARGIDEALADSDSGNAAGASTDAEPPEVAAQGPFADEESGGDGFDRDIVLPEERLPYEDDFANDEGEDLDLDMLPEDEYFPANEEDNL